MNIWKPLDGVADWLRHSLGAHAQLRLGVMCVILSVPLMIYGPFSGEQFLIYEMSALALTLTGIGIVVGAEVLVKTEETEDAANGAAESCDKCGR